MLSEDGSVLNVEFILILEEALVEYLVEPVPRPDLVPGEAVEEHCAGAGAEHHLPGPYAGEAHRAGTTHLSASSRARRCSRGRRWQRQQGSKRGAARACGWRTIKVGQSAEGVGAHDDQRAVNHPAGGGREPHASAEERARRTAEPLEKRMADLCVTV